MTHEQGHVLLVGNFDLQNLDKGSFGLRAWNEVFAEYRKNLVNAGLQEEADLLPTFGPLWSMGDAQVRTTLRACLLPRSVTRYYPPKPIPLSDQVWQDPVSFRDCLLFFLRYMNTVAIVSASPAEYTEMLLTALGPIRIPVLITVATAVDIWPTSDRSFGAMRHALRLIPNNALQAQTIRAKVESIVSQWRQKDVGEVLLCHGDPTDTYTRDLKTEVLRLMRLSEDKVFSNAETLVKRLPTDKPAVILSVGYRDTLKSLIEQLPDRSGLTVLQSDGVSYDEYLEEIAPKPNSVFLLCRPAHDHSTYAKWAYSAVAAASAQAWRDSADRVGIERRLLAPIFRVREFLEKDKASVSFAGNENQSGGYYLSSVGPTHSEEPRVSA